VDVPTAVISFMVLTGNQAYFMGFFFFLAGLVTGPSLSRKGSWLFVKDRFIRLIIPVILYEVVFFPLLFWFVQDAWYANKFASASSDAKDFLDTYFGSNLSDSQVWRNYFTNYELTSNQFWFPVLLFTFSCITALLTDSAKSWKKYLSVSQEKLELNTRNQMIKLLLKLGGFLFILNYVFRLPQSNGYVWVAVLGNLGFIGQYMITFTAGILATHFQFLDYVQREHLRLTLGLSFLFYFFAQIFQTFGIGPIKASITYYFQNLFETLFEQFFAAFWSYSLLVIFK
jgi:glucan biosynthesis protein C